MAMRSVEFHTEVTTQEFLQPGDGFRLDPGAGGDVGCELIAGVEAVALELALGHLHEIHVPDHRLDAALDRVARGRRRIAMDQENLSTVADGPRHGLVGVPGRTRWFGPVN